MQQSGPPLSLLALYSPEVRADPYPLYKRLREEHPVYWDPFLGCWILTRYSDVAAAFHDPRLGSGGPGNPIAGADEQRLRPLSDMAARQLPYLDPPDHARIRGPIAAVFGPRLTQARRDQMRATCDALLADRPLSGRIDVIADYAFPLAAQVIAEFVGIPPDRALAAVHWGNDVADFLKGFSTGAVDADRSLGSFSRLHDYLDACAAGSLPTLETGVLSAHRRSETGPEPLSREEILANCMMLLMAGHETVVALIGLSVLALLRHPDQMARLLADPSLLEATIEECLRFDSPIQLVSRQVETQHEIDGHEFRQGDTVLLLIGAANRDPAVFHEPDQLDIARRDTRHLAFSRGIHYCLGASLALAEAAAAVERLLPYLPSLRIDEENLQWQAFPNMRGLLSLPLLVDA